MSLLKLLPILFLLLTQTTSSSSQHLKRNYLFSQYEEKGKSEAFLDADVWRASKKREIDFNIAALPAGIKASLISRAEESLKEEWRVLKVTDYLEYINSGRLEPYAGSSSERHNKLTFLIIAELVDGKGRFMPEIVNGLWLTLEESTWVLPQHLVLQKAGPGLPDPNEVVVDLLSGDIATLISWTRFLLFDELKSISPMLITRIDYELKKRIFDPFLSRSDINWMGFKGQRVNNWNIWINTNILRSALLTIQDDRFRNAVIEKTILSADNFLNQYPNDGGIDEGISYWKHAGGMLIQFVSLLTDFSATKLDWSKNELIHKMGSYVYKTHISDKNFVNFADASGVNIPPPFSVYKYGKLFNDLTLERFSAYLYKLEYPNGNRFEDGNLNAFVENIGTHKEVETYLPASPLFKQNWLPDLQVLTLREKQGSVTGLFFGVKGGHNGESHNHNDVGNFVVYNNGKPAIIDVGVGTYTRQTFSKDRYKLWYMQSQWHNCPNINGVEQKNGVHYKAKDVKYVQGTNTDVFSLDIAPTYPEEAKVKSWERVFLFSAKKRSLVLKERYVLEEFVKQSEIYFITPMQVKVLEKGALKVFSEGGGVLLNYNPLLFEVFVEDKELVDRKLSNVWGSKIRRIVFRSLNTSVSGSHSFTFTGID